MKSSALYQKLQERIKHKSNRRLVLAEDWQSQNQATGGGKTLTYHTQSLNEVVRRVIPERANQATYSNNPPTLGQRKTQTHQYVRKIKTPQITSTVGTNGRRSNKRTSNFQSPLLYGIYQVSGPRGDTAI